MSTPLGAIVNSSMYSTQSQLRNVIAFNEDANIAIPTFYDAEGNAHVMSTVHGTAPQQVAIRAMNSPVFYYAPGSSVEHVLNPRGDVIIDLINVAMVGTEVALPSETPREIVFQIGGYASASEFVPEPFATKLGTLFELPRNRIDIASITYTDGRLHVTVRVFEGETAGIVDARMQENTNIELSSRFGFIVMQVNVRVPLPEPVFEGTVAVPLRWKSPTTH